MSAKEGIRLYEIFAWMYESSGLSTVKRDKIKIKNFYEHFENRKIILLLTILIEWMRKWNYFSNLIHNK